MKQITQSSPPSVSIDARSSNRILIPRHHPERQPRGSGAPLSNEAAKRPGHSLPRRERASKTTARPTPSKGDAVPAESRPEPRIAAASARSGPTSAAPSPARPPRSRSRAVPFLGWCFTMYAGHAAEFRPAPSGRDRAPRTTSSPPSSDFSAGLPA